MLLEESLSQEIYQGMQQQSDSLSYPKGIQSLRGHQEESHRCLGQLGQCKQNQMWWREGVGLLGLPQLLESIERTSPSTSSQRRNLEGLHFIERQSGQT